MSGNVIKAFVATGTITKGTKSIVLGVATQTSNWSRPESGITETMKTGFKAAVQGDTKALPAQAEKIVMREPQHGNDNHYTAVVLDGNNKYVESRHY
ncbi:MAG: hypothetical protein LQ347_004337 [Umbilicaria vellea]|nr:MAG: hypothetical protein LQ347_004337 [Umbilicaria vellea]